MIMSIIIFIIILLVLVLSHEFGHFIVAKKSNIRVDEFSFGFPPKLFGKKIGETTYNFNALPLGGYVKIYGENPEELPAKTEESNNSSDDRSFVNKPWYIKVLVLLAGVTMNFIVAWLLLSIGFISGLPTSVSVAPKGAIIENQALTVVGVVSGSPAEKAGLRSGDKISALTTNNGKTTTLTTSSNLLTPKVVQSFVKKHSNEKIDFSIIRGKTAIQINVIPKFNKANGIAMVGISMDTIGTLHLPVYKAIFEGLKLSYNLTIKTIVGFYSLIANSLSGHGSLANVSGPIGIIKIVGEAANFGFIYLLSLTALISINLVVINLIPFPALDGGRLLFLLIEKIKGSRIKPKIANIVNSIGFALLMIFMVVITYHDIIRLLVK